jgi:aspartyl-tRNA(Asn)/glutamyl-tRNA(Gln) amidotransferase subunit B
MGELGRVANEQGRPLEDAGVSPEQLAELVGLVDAGTINSSTAKVVFERMLGSGRRAGDIVREDGLAQISDERAVLTVVHDVIGTHPDAVSQYRGGKTATFGFLVGQVMKATRGKASPALVNDLLRRELDRG